MRREDSREAGVLRGGLDEVGMGALAGPIVVAVTVFSGDPVKEVADSKRLTRKRRERLMPIILDEACYIGLGWADPKIVDAEGVACAWQFAAETALANIPPDTHLIVDGVRAPLGLPPHWRGEVVVEKKADANHWEVSAASIVAKVIHDLDMIEMAARYPSYGWAKNVGYGTAAHYEQLKAAGPTPYHRMSFLKNMIKKGELPPATPGVGVR